MDESPKAPGRTKVRNIQIPVLAPAFNLIKIDAGVSPPLYGRGWPYLHLLSATMF
jgi:hypothetical protein